MCPPGCVLFTLILCLNPLKAINIPLLLIIVSNLQEWGPLEEYLTSHALEKNVFAEFTASGKIRKCSICCDVMFDNFSTFPYKCKRVALLCKIERDQNLTMIQIEHFPFLCYFT